VKLWFNSSNFKNLTLGVAKQYFPRIISLEFSVGLLSISRHWSYSPKTDETPSVKPEGIFAVESKTLKKFKNFKNPS
jgi:hypothetical protein